MDEIRLNKNRWDCRGPDETDRTGLQIVVELKKIPNAQRNFELSI